MANGDEILFPGGLYFNGDYHDSRSEVSLVQSGPMKNCGPEYDGLITLGLRIVTGSCEFELLGIAPAELVRLGKWITKVAASPEFARRANDPPPATGQ